MNADKELIVSGRACVNHTPNADLIESAKIVTATNWLKNWLVELFHSLYNILK